MRLLSLGNLKKISLRWSERKNHLIDLSASVFALGIISMQ